MPVPLNFRTALGGRVVTRGRRPAIGTQARIAWTAVWFAVGHVAFAAYFDVRHPEVYDPEFGDRLAALSRLQPADPERPLLFVVGSSRIATNFRPEALPELR